MRAATAKYGIRLFDLADGNGIGTSSAGAGAYPAGTTRTAATATPAPWRHGRARVCVGSSELVHALATQTWCSAGPSAPRAFRGQDPEA